MPEHLGLAVLSQHQVEAMAGLKAVANALLLRLAVFAWRLSDKLRVSGQGRHGLGVRLERQHTQPDGHHHDVEVHGGAPCSVG